MLKHFLTIYDTKLINTELFNRTTDNSNVQQQQQQQQICLELSEDNQWAVRELQTRSDNSRR